MERIVLAAILIATLAALARIVWRSARPVNPAASPACRGCPLAGECSDRADERVSLSSGRADGADHGR